MNKLRILIIGLAFAAPSVYAADHADGPRASADPSADITDVFTWMSPDAGRVYLVMDLVRNASTSSRFSDSVRYVFHTQSQPNYGSSDTQGVDIVCTFNGYRTQHIDCHIGHGNSEKLKVVGFADNTNGITSRDGRIKVFAGLRNDPFFFNLAGFKAVASAVASAASSLSFDAAGCPALDAATSAALVNQLATAPGGGPAIDNFLGFNVLSIVLSIDKSVLTKGGPIVSFWGSTNRESDDENATTLQIDRMGRAGVNTALTNPFFLPSGLAGHEAAQDAYNAESDPSQWQAEFASEIAGNLAILDSLDRNCGNQLLAGPSPVPGRYSALAGVLADDRLYVNTNSGACHQYLAVEANAVGIANDDCGGRTPLENTIDTTYSVLAAGALSGVTNGITSDADGTASLTVFPFLTAPNQ